MAMTRAMQVDLSALYLGIGGYAAFRVAQHLRNKRAPPRVKKIVDDDKDEQNQAHVESCARAADPSPPKLNSVLPSGVFIQLAILVVAFAAARHVELPPQAMIAPCVLFVFYRLNYSSLALPTLPKKAAQHPALAEEVREAATTPESLKEVANPPRGDVAESDVGCSDEKEQLHVESCDGAAGPKPLKLNSVIPSTLCIQLALFVVAFAAARHVQLPPQAMIAPCVLFVFYRLNYSRLALPTLPRKTGVCMQEAALAEKVREAATTAKAHKAETYPPKCDVKEAYIGCDRNVGSTAHAGTPNGPRPVTHSVLPSPLAVELAVIIAASATAFHLDIPAAPMKGAFVMFFWYRIILYKFKPAKKSDQKKC